MPTLVSFQSVSKHFGSETAVSNLDLDIREGEFLTLLGPSGSGKTTALRMLAGLEGLSSGTITLGGSPVDQLVPEKRDIGMVFQHYALFPNMTVRDNIAFPLRMRKRAKAETSEKVEQALTMTGLTALAERHPTSLSGGQQQRVALARAFVYNPRILLMDEPLGALDRNLRDHMRLELKSLQHRIGATVLYVTHDQDEALAMSDRIAVMHQGVLQQVAPPRDVYEYPANSFVAGFVGDSFTANARCLSRGTDLRLAVPDLGCDVLVASRGASCAADEGTMTIRPERLTLSTHEPSEPCNRALGTIAAIEYLGLSETVIVRLASGVEAKAHRQISGECLEVGTEVWMSWSKQDTRFLPTVS